MKILQSAWSFLTSSLTFLVAVLFAAVHDALVLCGVRDGGFVACHFDTPTQIDDLWVPELWRPTLAEAVISEPHFLRSEVVIGSKELAEFASGPGTDVNIPFYIEPNPADQVQKERTAPTIGKLTTGNQRAAILQRVSPLGATALAKQLSGSDPVAQILGFVVGIRYRQRATALWSQIKGLYGLASAANSGTGVMRGLRLDNFVEVVGNQTAAHLIDSDMALDAIALMGEAKMRLEGGVAWMHSKIETALNKQDQIEVIRNSEGKILMKSYKGLRVIIDDRLVRAGTTSGYVYTTILAARASIAHEEKPQIVTDKAGEVAALQMSLNDIAQNETAIYDRTRYVLHVQGAKWNPADVTDFNADGGTPANADLEDPANWGLAFADVRNVGMVVLRTNG